MNHTPYLTTAKFNSTCPETGKPIRKGDPIAYYPATKQAFCESSKAYAEVKALAFAQAWGMADAGW